MRGSEREGMSEETHGNISGFCCSQRLRRQDETDIKTDFKADLTQPEDWY